MFAIHVATSSQGLSTTNERKYGKKFHPILVVRDGTYLRKNWKSSFHDEFGGKLLLALYMRGGIHSFRRLKMTMLWNLTYVGGDIEGILSYLCLPTCIGTVLAAVVARRFKKMSYCT